MGIIMTLLTAGALFSATQQYLPVASEVWGPIPNCAKLNIYAYSNDPLDPPGIIARATPNDGHDYGAPPCSILFNNERLSEYDPESPKYNRWSFCTMVVHEVGHLVGQKHSADPRNVMYISARAYWRCNPSYIRRQQARRPRCARTGVLSRDQSPHEQTAK